MSDTDQDVREFVVSLVEQVTQAQLRVNLTVEDRLELLDKTIATILPAYMECVSLLQALVSIIVNRSEEEKEEFYKLVREGRKDMMDLLGHGMRNAERDATKFVASPSVPDEGPEGSSN